MKKSLFVCLFFLCYSAHAEIGELDLTFGSNGVVNAFFPSGPANYGVTGFIDPTSEDIFIAGTIISANFNVGLAHISKNGTIINSTTYSVGASDTTVTDVAEQQDGEFVTVGISNNGTTSSMVAMRFKQNLTFDSSYGTVSPGVIFINPDGAAQPSVANTVAIDNQGRAVIGGSSTDSSGKINFAFARLTTQGQLDTSFDLIGTATFRASNFDDVILDLGIQSTGKIVAAGYSSKATPLYLVRLLSDGSLDATFNGGGIFNTGITLNVLSAKITILPDDTFLVAGVTGGIAPTVFITKFFQDGVQDTSFGVNGGFAQTISALFDLGFPRFSLAVLNDGSMMVSWPLGEIVLIAKFTATGHVDDSFGDLGIEVYFPEELNAPEQNSIFLSNSLFIQNQKKAVSIGTSAINQNITMGLGAFRIDLNNIPAPETCSALFNNGLFIPLLQCKYGSGV